MVIISSVYFPEAYKHIKYINISSVDEAEPIINANEDKYPLDYFIMYEHEIVMKSTFYPNTSIKCPYDCFPALFASECVGNLDYEAYAHKDYWDLKS
jgi:hypothetical protein